jgi:hypothetical protein
MELSLKADEDKALFHPVLPQNNMQIHTSFIIVKKKNPAKSVIEKKNCCYICTNITTTTTKEQI